MNPNRHTVQSRHPRPVRSHAPASEPNNASARMVVHLAKSVGVTMLIGLFLLFACSAIAYLCPDPNSPIQALGLIASALTALFGGMAAVKIHKHAALLCGLLNGLATMAWMLLLSLFFATYASAYSASISCLLHLSFLGLSVLGACLGLPKSSGKRKKKKH